MPLIIATGSNLGERELNLLNAQNCLEEHFQLVSKSRIYESSAVDYLSQPDFYNQVLEFETPALSPADTMTLLLDIEKQLGRERKIAQGPRVIDIDILFYDSVISNDEHILLPHPRLFERSFVVLPLRELNCFSDLQKKYFFPETFTNSARPIRLR
ncbi:2-amino-4-hydroxy-6-hydroxymethyldihydropteridine diphosphokinase [Halobacteriovorax marinus]|uniref:2-amino-4-hydroxy-6-hydroxymethyldihydropteridine pyrophosphokinase n=1 Tax=Halobacteriovorax marinus TaxID=97084 RepID=A0A1Y5F7M3_9BACT|nr:2-amino-4-hydroxy-6-hydroxymethyldihydropteridine diphosphokinase [Halobacteriovorax marinus]